MFINASHVTGTQGPCTQHCWDGWQQLRHDDGAPAANEEQVLQKAGSTMGKSGTAGARVC